MLSVITKAGHNLTSFSHLRILRSPKNYPSSKSKCLRLFFFPFFKFEVSVKLSFWISTCHRNLHELTDKHRTVINTLASSVLYASFELHLLVFVLIVRMNSCCYRVLNCCTVVYLTLTLSLKSFSVLLQRVSMEW